MVVGRCLAFQQRGDEHPFAGRRQRLLVGLQGVGAGQLAAHLLADRQFAQAREARMLQGMQGGLGLVACQGQFRGEGAGEDLLGRQQLVQPDQVEDLLGLGQIALAQRLVGGAQAQQGGLFRLALLRLQQQLLGAGLRLARQFAEAGGLLAGTGAQQACQAEDGKGAQSGDHVRDSDSQA
ncbi:hypothetical protein D3C78_1301430 [compost metagenome]